MSGLSRDRRWRPDQHIVSTGPDCDPVTLTNPIAMATLVFGLMALAVRPLSAADLRCPPTLPGPHPGFEQVGPGTRSALAALENATVSYPHRQERVSRTRSRSNG